MDEDSKFIKETFRLAKKGMGWTYPNPFVGAVLVKNNKVVGAGFHKKIGSDHAEIEALNTTKNASGATLYVNLEPCSNYGKTPPCTDAIIKAKISRVVCSSLDPNPKVHGKGIIKLKKAGINVNIGTLQDKARLLNEAFFTFYEKKKTFIAAKFASSLDGKIATKIGDSKWITNTKARLFARYLRSQYQAVLVGINTILADNPNLGVGIKGKKDPLRIVLDSQLRIPLTSKVLRDSNILIATTSKASGQKIKYLQNRDIVVVVFEEDRIPISKLLSFLKEKEIISILVEGGGKVLGAFFDEGLVDKVYAFYSPVIIGGEKAVSAIGGEGVNIIKNSTRLKNLSLKYFGDNYLVTGYT